MGETLRSVGLDVGTTSTQMVLSRLTVENRGSSFSVPEMEITGREIIWRSPVYFTPFLDETHVDGEKIREILAEEYRKAGISQKDVDTGAVIITGETARKENARAVLEAVSEFAGEFVAATAGPDLESVLAAKGAGATEFSRQTGKTVLHMDIGGGTSNLSLIADGQIQRTGCLDVGGRLITFRKNGEISYVSPALAPVFHRKPGEIPEKAELEALAETLARVLEMAAGLRPETELLQKFSTGECSELWKPAPPGAVISFSGGVADCIETEHADLEFGDLGPLLGRAIRRSRLCGGEYRLGTETIRATVIGAGCHSAQLSGSTVFVRGISLPRQDLPVVHLTAREQETPGISRRISELLDRFEGAVLALPGWKSPDYGKIRELAGEIARGFGSREILVCLENDMAKALGQALALQLPESRGCLCIDRVRLEQNSYLDIGAPAGPALPVVVKTLILNR